MYTTQHYLFATLVLRVSMSGFRSKSEGVLELNILHVTSLWIYHTLRKAVWHFV